MKGSTMIKVSINGEVKELKENTSVKEMLDIFDYSGSKTFAVAINTTFVSIKNYEDTIIKDGDEIDILAPIQGG